LQLQLQIKLQTFLYSENRNEYYNYKMKRLKKRTVKEILTRRAKNKNSMDA